MLDMESLQVAEEEVVESSSNKLCDVYSFVAKGCFPDTMNPLRKKNLKRYAQKFIIDGKPRLVTFVLREAEACVTKLLLLRHLETSTCDSESREEDAGSLVLC